ncbi:hypothetical protein N0B21_20725 [Bacillus velezensis]|uniref:hypothetical protein n=1 Tax=Bacillus velezensis TaxID=492670 RepID=UPI0021B10F84|nr:hypothetical protein [Bacillus velezensis]MCT6684609.1 hypothetical protein [Bacillus velezensis]
MFKDVLDKLLKGEYSARTIRKAHSQEKKIRGVKNVPHYDLEETARRKLEEILDGGVQYKYARETLIALQYCSNHHHYLTDALLIDDIVSHKRITFNNYLKTSTKEQK